MSHLLSCGLDLGRSGKTAIAVISGTDWHLRLIHLEEHSSISAPDVENAILRVYARFQPKVIILEMNGPGGVFAEFAVQKNPGLPLLTVDVSHPPIDLQLWPDFQFIPEEYLNIRAEEYFIVHYLLKHRRLKFPYEDAELFAQLSSTYWDLDKTKAEKIRLMPKKNMKVSDFSNELEGLSFSRSPDKADALAMACLGYALIASNEALDTGEQVNDVISPLSDGLFNIGEIDLEEL